MISPEESERNLGKLSDPNRGRLVAISLSEDGQFFRLFTGMGGRSAGSKNRYYQRLFDMSGHGEYIRTAVHDPSLQQGDASATLYNAQRSWRDCHVASNGEQTDGIAVALALGVEFTKAQALYRHEDAVNLHTPRITVALEMMSKKGYVHIGKIVPNPDNLEEPQYHTYLIGDIDSEPDFLLNPGEGYFTATYDGKGEVGANYEEPWGILLRGSLEDNMDSLWYPWDPNTRGNLAGKEIDRGSGRFRYTFRSIHPGRS